MSDLQDTTDGRIVHAGRYQEAPIGAARKPVGVRWRRMLVLFMRLAACVWILKGLLNWLFMIGLGDEGFPDLRLSRQGIIIILAVLDLVAAVGLWLASSWGAAVWLMVLVLEAAVPFLVPDMVRPVTDAVMAVIFGCAYAFLVWRAVKEEEGN